MKAPRLDFDPTGYWLSEKLDGIQARWTGAAFYTRNGKLIAAPDWFKAGLPDRELVGELWIARGQFEAMLSVWRSGQGWERVCFAIFDVPGESFPAPLGVMEATPFAFVIPQVLCESVRHFQAFFADVVSNGGEGVMIRRNCFVEKVKPEREDSFLVVGFSREGSALLQRRGVDCGKVALQGNYEPFEVGDVVDVSFQERTTSGKLRFPAFRRARPDLDPAAVA